MGKLNVKRCGTQIRVLGVGGHAVNGSGPWTDGEVFMLATGTGYQCRRWDARQAMTTPLGGIEATLEEAMVDVMSMHLWGSAPTIEQTEHGPVAWWLCGRCPARVLHDPESEDGFPPEPIVVYPPSCFERDIDEIMMADGSCPACRCGCPRRASGDVVHLEGCVDQTARVEAHLRELDEEAGFTGPLSLAREIPCELQLGGQIWSGTAQRLAPEPCVVVGLIGGAGEEGAQHQHYFPNADDYTGNLRPCACGAEPSDEIAAPEPDIIVHPPTDPAPPSEELTRAIEDAEEDIPTQRYPVAERGPSVFERIERLFGRPILGDAR